MPTGTIDGRVGRARRTLRSLTSPTTHRALLREITALLRASVTYTSGFKEESSAVRHAPMPRTHRDAPTALSGAPDPYEVPVLLIHGFGHNRSGWAPVKKRLEDDGFHNVFTFNYNPLVHDVRRIAERVRLRVERICEVSGHDHVQLVGHSMGGIVARFYVQFLGGHERVLQVLTIASPHRGTALVPSSLRLNASLRQIGWKSKMIQQMRYTPSHPEVVWTSIFTRSDELVVPAESAMIDTGTFNGENVEIRGEGHVSLMYSKAVANVLSQRLSTMKSHPRFRRPAEDGWGLAETAT